MQRLGEGRNEARIALADLGFDNANCRSDMRAVIYFDNGIVDDDDNNPDTGVFTLSCGNPTAVSLLSSSARSSNLSLALLFGLIGLGAAGALAWRVRTQ